MPRTLVATLLALAPIAHPTSASAAPSPRALPDGVSTSLRDAGYWFATEAGAGGFEILHLTRAGLLRPFRTEASTHLGMVWTPADRGPASPRLFVLRRTAAPSTVEVTRHDEGLPAATVEVAPDHWKVPGFAPETAPTLRMGRDGTPWLMHCRSDPGWQIFVPCTEPLFLRIAFDGPARQTGAVSRAPTGTRALLDDLAPGLPYRSLRTVPAPQGYRLRLHRTSLSEDGLLRSGRHVPAFTCTGPQSSLTWPSDGTPAWELRVAPGRARWISSKPPMFVVEGTTRSVRDEALPDAEVFRACEDHGDERISFIDQRLRVEQKRPDVANAASEVSWALLFDDVVIADLSGPLLAAPPALPR